MSMETGTGMTLRNREKTSYEEPDPTVLDDFDLNTRAENEIQDEISEAAEAAESLNSLTDADLQKEIEEEERKITALREKRKREENERKLIELRRSRLEIES